MVDLMKIEDPFLPLETSLIWTTKERRTKRALLSLGGSLFCVRVCSQACSSLDVGRAVHKHRARGTPPLPPRPTQSHHVCCLLYWCCRLGERELEPGLGGSEPPLGARRA